MRADLGLLEAIVEVVLERIGKGRRNNEKIGSDVGCRA